MLRQADERTPIAEVAASACTGLRGHVFKLAVSFQQVVHPVPSEDAGAVRLR